MRKWVGCLLVFLGFLGVVPIAWGVTDQFLRTISAGGAESAEAILSLVILVLTGVSLAMYGLFAALRDR
jgi:hypothetical protein